MAFNIVAQLQVRGPQNLTALSKQIQSQLGRIKANINLTVAQGTTRQIGGLNRSINTLTGNLGKLTIAANNAAGGIANLGRAAQNAQSQVQNVASSTKSINTALAKTRTAAASTGNTFELMGKQAAAAVKRFGAFSAVTVGIFNLVQAFSRGAKQAIKFQHEMVKVAQVTGAPLASIQGLSKEITRLATTFGVTSEKLANISVTLSQTGLSAKDTKIALEALAKTQLAATFSDVENTVEGAIAAMHQFDIETSQLDTTLSAFNTVAAKFAVESEDIVTAVRRAGGAFKASGGSLNEFIALFTSVRQTTRESAETIATGFRTIFTRIQRPRTLSYLKELGIDLQDATGNFVGAFEAVRRLNAGLSQLETTDPRFAEIVEELGGYRQVTKVIPLIQQFGVAQKALNDANRAGSSLTKDAIVAQQAFAVQITKVKEEFLDLFRIIGENKVIKTFLGLTLELSKALISVAKALTPILPILVTAGVFKAGAGVKAFGSGFLGSFVKKSDGGPVKFARGGFVPGQGNTDSVPALLQPGEFVIKKSAAQALGQDALFRMNKKIGGSTGTGEKPLTRRQIALALQDIPGGPTISFINKLPKDSPQYQNFANQARGIISAKQQSKIQKQSKEKSFIPQIGAVFLSPSRVNPEQPRTTQIDGKSVKFIQHSASLDETTSTRLKNNIILPKVREAIRNSGKALSAQFGAQYEGIQHIPNKGGLLGSIFEGALISVGTPFDKPGKGTKADQRGFDFPLGLQGRGASIFGNPKLDTNIPVEAKFRRTQHAQESIAKKFKNLYKKNALLPQQLAVGGQVDSVPALLTPGEFVLNKSSAEKIGYQNLNRLNNVEKFAAGGPVGGINAGQGIAGGLFIAGSFVNQLGFLDDKVKELVGTFSSLALGMAFFGRNLNSTTPQFDKFKSRIEALNTKSVARQDVLRQQITDSQNQFMFANPDDVQELNRLQTRQARRQAVLQARQERNDRLSRNTNIAQGIGFAASLTGGYLSSVGAQQIQAGRSGIGKSLSVAGGALAGAGTGALLGATLGGPFAPLTAAIGAAAGGIIGATAAFIDSEKQIREVKFDKTLDIASRDIANIFSKKGALSTSGTRINRNLSGSLSGLIGISAEERQAGVSKISGNLQQYTELASKLVETSSSLGEFRNKFGGLGTTLISVISTITGQTLSELNQQFEDEIKTRQQSAEVQKNLSKATQDVAKKLSLLDILVPAFEDLKQHITDTNQAFEILGGQAESIFKVGQIGGGILSRPFSTGNVAGFERATRIALGPEGNSIAEENAQAVKLIQSLPNILDQILNKPALENEDLSEQFASLVGESIENEAVKKRFQTGLEKILSSGEHGRESLLKDIRESPQKVIEELSSLQKTMFEAAEAVAKLKTEIQQEIATRNESILKVRESRQALQIQRQEAILSGSKINASIFDKDFLLKDFDNVSQAINDKLLQQGGLGFGANPNNVANEISRLQSIISEDVRKRESVQGTDAAIPLEQSIQDNTFKLNTLKTYLDRNIRSTDRLSQIQDDLSKLRGNREAVKDIVKSFVFGTQEEKFDTSLGLNAFAKVLQSRDITSVPENLRKQVGGLFDTFAANNPAIKKIQNEVLTNELRRTDAPETLIKALEEGSKEEINLKAELLKEEDRIIKNFDASIQVFSQNINALNTNNDEAFDNLGTRLELSQKEASALPLRQNLNAASAKAVGLRQRELDVNKAAKIAGVTLFTEIGGKKIFNPKALGELNKIGASFEELETFGKQRKEIANIDSVLLSARNLSNEDFLGDQLFGQLLNLRGGVKSQASLKKLFENPKFLESFQNRVGFDLQKEDIDKLITGFTDTGFIGKEGILGKGALSISDTLENFLQNRKSTTKESFDVLQKDLLIRFPTTLDSLVDNIDKIGENLSGFNESVPIKQISKEWQEAIGNFHDITTELEGITGEIKNLRKEIAGKASGGIIRMAGGGSIFKPRGTDTVPAMLTPGEFVVNARATRENRGILEDINAGYFADGGRVENIKKRREEAQKALAKRRIDRFVKDPVNEELIQKKIEENQKKNGEIIRQGIGDVFKGKIPDKVPELEPITKKGVAQQIIEARKLSTALERGERFRERASEAEIRRQETANDEQLRGRIIALPNGRKVSVKDILDIEKDFRSFDNQPGIDAGDSLGTERLKGIPLKDYTNLLTAREKGELPKSQGAKNFEDFSERSFRKPKIGSIEGARIGKALGAAARERTAKRNAQIKQQVLAGTFKIRQREENILNQPQEEAKTGLPVIPGSFDPARAQRSNIGQRLGRLGIGRGNFRTRVSDFQLPSNQIARQRIRTGRALSDLDDSSIFRVGRGPGNRAANPEQVRQDNLIKKRIQEQLRKPRKYGSLDPRVYERLIQARERENSPQSRAEVADLLREQAFAKRRQIRGIQRTRAGIGEIRRQRQGFASGGVVYAQNGGSINGGGGGGTNFADLLNAANTFNSAAQSIAKAAELLPKTIQHEGNIQVHVVIGDGALKGMEDGIKAIVAQQINKFAGVIDSKLPNLGVGNAMSVGKKENQRINGLK